MPVTTVTGTALAQNSLGTPGVPRQQRVTTLLHLEAVRRRLHDKRKAKDRASQMHNSAAPVIALVLDGFGKDDAAAEAIGEPKQHVSDMRHGARGVSAWQLLLWLTESDGAFMALAAIMCERHSLTLPTPISTVELTTDEARAFDDARRECGPAIWLHVGARIAAMRGTSLDLFDVAITDHLRMGRP